MTTAATTARWGRLADTLADVTPATVIEGRERCEIIVRTGQKLIVIHDTWSRRNIDLWTGWEVYIEGPDALTERTFPKTKKRGEVRRQVAKALGVVVTR